MKRKSMMKLTLRSCWESRVKPRLMFCIWKSSRRLSGDISHIYSDLYLNSTCRFLTDLPTDQASPPSLLFLLGSATGHRPYKMVRSSHLNWEKLKAPSMLPLGEVESWNNMTQIMRQDRLHSFGQPPQIFLETMGAIEA